MPEKTNLFVFGCSFTKDNYQKTWADLLAEEYNLVLINCAERGAGSAFAINRLLTENITDQDLVAIMWPSADRIDLWSDHTVPHLLSDREYASWPDGKSAQLVDFYGNYRNDLGFNLNGSLPRGYKNNYYKFFYTSHQAVHNWYIDIITAQLYLSSKNIKYFMCSAFPLLNPIHYHTSEFWIQKEIYNRIDLSTFVKDSETQGFYGFCRKHQLPFLDTHHPLTQSHQRYVHDMLKSSMQELLIK